MSDFSISENTITEVLNDSGTQALIKEAIQKSICNSIESSFKCYGDLHKAIENKVNEVLIPYIENYDIQKHIPKLDTVLTDIINQTTLMDNKKILENFRELMIEPESKTVTLEQIFKQYCKYMAENVDTSNLEISTDDGPHYESFECYCELENVSSDWSHYERYDAVFRCDDSIDDDENKTFSIHLRKWKDNNRKDYELELNHEIRVDSLRYLNDFEIYLLKLIRAGVKVTDIQEFTEDVEPTAEPEVSFS